MSMTDRIHAKVAKRDARDRSRVFGAPEQDASDPDALPDGTAGNGTGGEPPPATPSMDQYIRAAAARNRRR